MIIRSLQTTNYRQHRGAKTWRFDGSLVGVIGPNGSGKTAALEALSLFTPGRGLRSANPADLAQHGAPRYTVYLTLLDAQGISQTMGQTMAQNGGQKTSLKAERVLLVDGHRTPWHQLPTHVQLCWLTPAQDGLFAAPAATRRDWLDDAASAWQPAHAVATQRFRQHRQRRLKLLSQGEHLRATGQEWLSAEEALVAEWGLAVLHGRKNYCTALAVHLPPTLTLGLHGGALAILDEPDPIAALQGKLFRSRDIDAQLGRTHAGPNTLDVTGTLTLTNGTSVPLHLASGGQHKLALVQWLWAHVQLLSATHGTPPIVLIDEFTAHLDEPRRQWLFTQLATAGCQVWLTDTSLPTHLPPHTHVLPLGEEAPAVAAA
jgi:DNA replication and repair protein RecF